MAGIFKAYDIRGIYGQELTDHRSYLIGRGLAVTVFGSRGPIVVGRDMRLHSPQVSGELIRGLREGGCEVVDMGLTSTPMNYWANVHLGCQGSVMVTASHNGPAYNGLKVSGPAALPVSYEDGLNEVEAFVARAEAGEPLPPPLPAEVRSEPDLLNPYLDFMDQFLEDPAPGVAALKIAVDAGNGMAGSFLPHFFERHSWLQPVPLYWELDGTFPHHEADPLDRRNLVDVQSMTRAQQCDFGVAFDGDADRAVFVDEMGRAISSDLITALLAGEALHRHPATPVLYDLRSSLVVPETIAEHGGTPIRCRVGHSFIKRMMKQTGARFGGELSGHFYFNECYDTDSALMALIEVVRIRRQRGLPFSSLMAPLRRYSATGEINFEVNDVAAALDRVRTHFATRGGAMDDLDGLTVREDGWWFNLRPSNTEPLLRLNLEATTEAERDRRLDEVKRLLVHHWTKLPELLA